MAVLTGSGGALRFRGQRVGKVREWSLSIDRDALETSCLGSHDRSYVPGMRGSKGQATVLYDPDDTSATALLNSIFENDASADAVGFVLSMAGGKELACQAFLTSISPSISVGDIVAVGIGLQVSGPIDGQL